MALGLPVVSGGGGLVLLGGMHGSRIREMSLAEAPSKGPSEDAESDRASDRIGDAATESGAGNAEEKTTAHRHHRLLI